MTNVLGLNKSIEISILNVVHKLVFLKNINQKYVCVVK